MTHIEPMAELLRSGVPLTPHEPWPCAIVDIGGWQNMAAQVASGRVTLLSLWGSTDRVHAALRQEMDVAMVALECPSGRFPSIGAVHLPAIRLERSICDLFGFVADGAHDLRPWLDHGQWGVRHPMSSVPHTERRAAPAYEFLPAEGESLHVIPVGPVHAGIIEPGHFRFTANGEAVVRLEERLGYAHKGIESLMQGTDLENGMRLASRSSGDSTVAYALAFARAVEAALGIQPPPRAHYVRAIMAELERLANHCGDFGAICNDATFTILHANCAVLKEHVLRTAAKCFGHRLMMDRVQIGGAGIDLSPNGVSMLRTLISVFRRTFPRLVSLYDASASVQDRTVSTGVLSKELAAQFGCGGFVGRASGRDFDVRKAVPYPPYDALRFEVPVRADGDVNARIWVRILEIEQSLSLIEQLIDQIPNGPARAEFASVTGHNRFGAALVEGFRGDIFVWVQIAPDGALARCHLRDPSWFQWPLLEAAIEGNIVADFPICNKSFNCSYAGHDL